MTYFQIMDMHSGGGTKFRRNGVPVEYFYVLAEDAEQAKVKFEAATGQDPEWVSCDTCGPNYSVGWEPETLEQATAYYRNCAFDNSENKYVERANSWGTYQTLEEYLARPDVMIIE